MLTQGLKKSSWQEPRIFTEGCVTNCRDVCRGLSLRAPLYIMMDAKEIIMISPRYNTILSFYHDVLAWPLRTRHQEIQLVIQREALLAAESYLDLLHFFEDELHGNLTFVLHFQHASAMRIDSGLQDVEFLQLFESEHLRLLNNYAFEVITRNADLYSPLLDVHYYSLCHYDVLTQIEAHEDLDKEIVTFSQPFETLLACNRFSLHS